MLSDRYKDAMIFAARLHDRQTRKGTEVAYLTHLISVSALVMENGGDEDQGIAALLHDALEDQGLDYESEYFVEPRQGRPALKRDIELRYGTRVLAIVIGCTDDEDFAKPAASERGSVEAWRARKQAYIQHARKLSAPSLRVSAADKVHNSYAILRDLRNSGERVWGRFKATPDDVVAYYESLVRAYREAGGGLLVDELDRIVRGIQREMGY